VLFFSLENSYHDNKNHFYVIQEIMNLFSHLQIKQTFGNIAINFTLQTTLFCKISNKFSKFLKFYNLI
jgi:hypothetical protein